MWQLWPHHKHQEDWYHAPASSNSALCQSLHQSEWPETPGCSQVHIPGEYPLKKSFTLIIMSTTGLPRPVSVSEDNMTLSWSEVEPALRLSSKFTMLSSYPPSCTHVKHGLCTRDTCKFNHFHLTCLCKILKVKQHDKVRHRSPLCSKHAHQPHHVDETPSQRARPHHQDVRQMYPTVGILWQTVHSKMLTQWPTQMIQGHSRFLSKTLEINHTPGNKQPWITHSTLLYQQESLNSWREVHSSGGEKVVLTQRISGKYTHWSLLTHLPHMWETVSCQDFLIVAYTCILT